MFDNENTPDTPETPVAQSAPESQSDATLPEHTGETAQAASGAPGGENEQNTSSGTDEPDTGQENAEDDPQDGADDTDNADVGKLRKEAANHRRRARDAESDLSYALNHLTAERRHMVDHRAKQAGVDPALLDANGLDTGMMTTDAGVLDIDAADQFIEETANRFNLKRGFTRNRAQDMSGGPAPKTGLADAFRR